MHLEPGIGKLNLVPVQLAVVIHVIDPLAAQASEVVVRGGIGVKMAVVVAEFVLAD
jgi:hypothetical protein